MTNVPCSPAHLSDEQLLAEVHRLVARERVATAQVIASLAELDARGLYLGAGYSSLFTYCTQVLHLSEHAAYARIEAARAARKFPFILELLAEGTIHLTAIGLVAPHLTPENHATLLRSVCHKSKREIEQMIACLKPRLDVASSIRKLPGRPPGVAIDGLAGSDSPSTAFLLSQRAAPVAPLRRPATVAPLAPERYKVQFTVSKDTYDKLRRVQDLMRHTVPNGDTALIFDRALTVLLGELERKKFAATKRPRDTQTCSSDSRRIPAAVKRAVWARDEGRCAFAGSGGRCRETGFLEFHHVVPFAAGGETSVENLELRCRAHNAYESEKYFGRLFVRERGSGGWMSELGPDRVVCSVQRRGIYLHESSDAGPTTRRPHLCAERLTEEEPSTNACTPRHSARRRFKSSRRPVIRAASA